MFKLELGGRAIGTTTLAVATSNSNSKLHNRGLLSREMLLQRDQFTHWQIPVKDLVLIEQQQELKKRNQPSSAYSKNPKKYPPTHTKWSSIPLLTRTIETTRVFPAFPGFN